MADESQSAHERTEEPTPRRLEQAREDGTIPRSHELSAALLLLTGTLLLATAGGRALAGNAFNLLRTGAVWLQAEPLSVGGASAWLRRAGWEALSASLPLLGGLFAMALGVGLAQGRGVISAKPLAPQWDRISPLAGFKRLVSLESGVNLLKAVLKVTILSIVTYRVLRDAWPLVVSLIDSDVPVTVTVLRQTATRLAVTTGFTFLALAVADYGFQIYQTHKSLRMSRQDILREHREQEGDPQIKQRIRQIARARARQRMLQAVPTADVIVTNPTRIAVALKYDPIASQAPVVVAMGERKIAERIRAIAREAGVPIIENKPVARALRATAAIGKPIPPALYVAVAEILAFVYRTRGRVLGLRPEAR